MNDGATIGKPNEQKKFLDEVKQSLNKLVTLKIETVVETNPARSALTTEIDLLQGDIRNTFDSKYAGTPEDIRNFHARQVEKGQEIIDRNIASLKSLVEFVINNDLDK